MMTMSAQEKRELRKNLRNRRQALTPQQVQKASKLCAQRLMQTLSLRRLQHIALYIGNDGEIDPFVLCQRFWELGKHVYLPVLNPLESGKLFFCEVTPRTRLKTNRFGIPEPDPRRCRHIKAQYLSLVLMPLVAFDQDKNRMGMGGGFYDRSFEFIRRHPWRKPLLVGLAHEFQRRDSLPVEPWDIALDHVVTDRDTY